jgi:hypothetical protein
MVGANPIEGTKDQKSADPLWSFSNCINASGVFERLANPLTGRRNIGWPLAAHNSNYYSTNIESLGTE